MGKNIYNNESSHSKLIEDLKSLPKFQAPENFEYNLMTRIQNKNFGETQKERIPFNLTKFLAPSAVVVTGLIIFFVFFSTSKRQTENPFMAIPPAIVNDSSKNIALNNQVESQGSITEPSMAAQNKNSLNARIQPNDVVVKKQSKYPINSRRSISLDDFISGDSQQNSNLERGNVVSDGGNSDEFDGFFVRQSPSKETIAKYRAYIDSLKKAQMKADSLKNAQK